MPTQINKTDAGQDRNFDDIADRFEKRIYGGLKGRVRLAVIDAEIEHALQLLGRAQLDVLDIGCGLGQHAIRLAEQGHKVVANELSQKMLDVAKQNASLARIAHPIDFVNGPYQDLSIEPSSLDLILCHAVIEWLAQPDRLFPAISTWLKPNGLMSLSFYNPAAKEYRNLIRGNFDWLEQQRTYESDDGSLTPNQPCSLEQVESWANAAGLSVIRSKGIRVFSDYIVERRGGLADEDSVLEMECRYAGKEPFKWLGRYIHLLLQRH